MSRDLALFKGILFDLPAEQRAKIEDIKNQISKIVTEGGDEGLLGLTWLALEIDEQQS